jgi:hypothetical protein
VAEQGRGVGVFQPVRERWLTGSTGFSEVGARDAEITASPPMNAQVLKQIVVCGAIRYLEGVYLLKV